MDKKNLICFFEKGKNADSLLLSTIDADTKLNIDKLCYEILPENILNYFKIMPKFITKSVKAAIFKQVNDFKNRNFNDSSQFIRFIQSEFKKHGIPLRLIDGETFTLTRLLIAAKVKPEIDQNFLFILISVDTIFVEEVYRVKSGYIRPPLKKTQVIKCSTGYDPVKIKAEILAEHSNPANKICIASFSIYSEKIYFDMIKIFESNKPLICDGNDENESIIEIVKHLLDQSYNQYYIIPKFLFTVINTQDQYTYELPCDLQQLENGLPFTISDIDERKHGHYYIEKYYKDQIESEVIETYPLLEGEYHRVKLTLNVDKNMIPTLLQEAYIDPSIEQLPATLTKKVSSKIPVIGFFDNSSVICLWNEKENCYKFSLNWNGLYGEDLYIAFHEEKPKYRKAAFQVLKEKPTFVVYGMLNILASKPDNLWINPNWPFKITKDEENPILLEFDNYDGTRKMATPEFLMALLLKDHLKVIKEETGTKPADIGIVFFDKFQNIEFYDRTLLPEKFKIACDLLKIECKIINVGD